MHLLTMLPPFGSLAPPTPTQHYWLVSCPSLYCFVLSTYSQGELAHRLVKRLYGLTNKQDAPGQVASRYRRENHFGSPESHDPTLAPPCMPEDCGSDDFLELHHTITDSRNNPISLSSFSNVPDPATKVRPHFLWVKPVL